MPESPIPDYRDIVTGNSALRIAATVLEVLGVLAFIVGFIAAVIVGMIAEQKAVRIAAIMGGIPSVIFGVLLVIAGNVTRMLAAIGMAIRDIAQHNHRAR